MPKKLFGSKNNVAAFRRRFDRVSMLALLVLGVAGAAPAAVVEKWSHHVQVNADGFTETSEWRVLMETQSDVAAWSEFPIRLDENRHLVSSEAWVVSPEGKRRKLKRKEKDLRDASSSFELASSRQYLIFEPEGLLPGGRLEVKATVREDAYYPGTVIHLRPAVDAFEQVSVTVGRSAGVEGFRHHVHGPMTVAGDSTGAGLKLQPAGSMLQVTGSWPRQPSAPSLAARSGVDPVMYLAWNSPDSWAGVARWYRGLLEGLPRTSPTLERQAQDLLAGLPSAAERSTARRTQLEVLVDFVRRKVRYVAVEVGIGGYRPTPSSETLERLWGDCKDKSFLLIDLLNQAGIEAYPALIRLDEDDRILDAFPNPFGFNHLIAAVPVEGLQVTAADPVADGFLFIDPTQTTGSARYLHRAVQDQHALVVTPSESRLVRTPLTPATQHIVLAADLKVDEQGGAEGQAVVTLLGDHGARLAQGLDSRAPGDIEQQLRNLVQALLPGAEIRRLTWEGGTREVPRFEAVADVRAEALVAGLNRGGAVRLEGFQWAPKPRDIDELEGMATSLPVATVENRFVLHLPDGLCPPDDRSDRVENQAGLFTQEVRRQGQVVEVVRRTEPAQSWFADDDLAELKALAVAEHRAAKRRLRFRCP